MIQHGTQEWWDSRKGIPTASRFDDLAAKGQGITAMRYVCEKVAEQLGAELPRFESLEMQWGITHEADAIEAYELRTFRKVQHAGFHIVDNDGKYWGATPDGLVGEDGILEVKCPATTTHLMTFVKGVPSQYLLQIEGELRATGRKWCDFVSYDPRCKGAELYIERVYPSDERFATIQEAVTKFYTIKDTILTKIKAQ